MATQLRIAQLCGFAGISSVLWTAHQQGIGWALAVWMVSLVGLALVWSDWLPQSFSRWRTPAPTVSFALAGAVGGIFVYQKFAATLVIGQPWFWIRVFAAGLAAGIVCSIGWIPSLWHGYAEVSNQTSGAQEFLSYERNEIFRICEQLRTGCEPLGKIHEKDALVQVEADLQKSLHRIEGLNAEVMRFENTSRPASLPGDDNSRDARSQLDAAQSEIRAARDRELGRVHAAIMKLEALRLRMSLRNVQWTNLEEASLAWNEISALSAELGLVAEASLAVSNYPKN